MQGVRDMELRDTVDYMISSNPIQRLEAEYLQTKIRVKSLEDFLEKYKNGVASLPPYTDYNILHRQFQTMLVYEKILEDRLKLIKEEGTWI